MDSAKLSFQGGYVKTQKAAGLAFGRPHSVRAEVFAVHQTRRHNTKMSQGAPGRSLPHKVKAFGVVITA